MQCLLTLIWLKKNSHFLQYRLWFVVVDVARRPSSAMKSKKPASNRRKRHAVLEPELALRNIAMPLHANSSGDIFGGWLLSQMDLAGGSVATRLAKGRVATIAITEMMFRRPVYVGDEVSCYAQIVKVGRTSATVRVEIYARRGRTGERIAVTEGVFTYVALDAKQKPRPIKRAYQ